MEEIWRPVYGFVGLYEMSTRGHVKSVDRYVDNQGGKYHVKEKILKPYILRNGYVRVVLSNNGIITKCLVHRLVAMTFPDLVHWTDDAKGRPFDELTVNHLNEVKTDNRVENLQWCPLKYNLDYGTGRERGGISRRKLLAQYTLSGELVKVWDGAVTAANELNVCRTHICNCAIGKKPTAYGYKWSYTNDCSVLF